MNFISNNISTMELSNIKGGSAYNDGYYTGKGVIATATVIGAVAGGVAIFG